MIFKPLYGGCKLYIFVVIRGLTMTGDEKTEGCIYIQPACCCADRTDRQTSWQTAVVNDLGIIFRCILTRIILLKEFFFLSYADRADELSRRTKRDKTAGWLSTIHNKSLMVINCTLIRKRIYRTQAGSLCKIFHIQYALFYFNIISKKKNCSSEQLFLTSKYIILSYLLTNCILNDYQTYEKLTTFFWP